MAESTDDTGVILALLERFETQRLPMALALKEKVDRGETLDDIDTGYLEEVFKDAMQVQTLIDRHPEYQELYARAVHLYKEITDKAMENEEGTTGAG